jgi:hypothetical protein
MNPLRRYLLPAACAVLLAVPAARAADSNGAYAPRGIGLDTCKDLVEILKAKDQRALLAMSWLDGYITAFNTYREGLYDVAPWQRGDVVLSLVAGHCEQHPDDRIAQVAQRLVDFLYPTRLETRSETVEAKSGDQSVRVYAAVLKRAQEELIGQGFLTGTADGAYGPKTKAALEAFQAKANIPQTGLPDAETLFRLLGVSKEARQG